MDNIIKNTPTDILSTAVMNITGLQGLSIDYDNLELIPPMNHELPPINLDRLKQEIATVTFNTTKEGLFSKLDEVHLRLSNNFRKELLGKDTTQAVYDEYKKVEEAVINNRLSFFSYDADIFNTTVEYEFNEASKKVKAYNESLTNVTMILRAIRRKLSKAIESNDSRVQTYLDRFEKVSVSINIEDMRSIFR